jgi:hypothetical protein
MNPTWMDIWWLGLQLSYPNRIHASMTHKDHNKRIISQVPKFYKRQGWHTLLQTHSLSLSPSVSHGEVLFENQLIIHTLSCCNPPLFWLISVSLDKTCWHLKTNIAEFPCMLLLCLFKLVGQPHPFGSDGFLNTFVVRGPKA